MAIWSSFQRLSSVLSGSACEECSGNGQLPPTEDQIKQFVCGANICTSCGGTGFNTPKDEVLEHVRRVLR